MEIQKDWYKIKGLWMKYVKEGGYLDGRKLSTKEREEFEKENFDLLFPQQLHGTIKRC